MSWFLDSCCLGTEPQRQGHHLPGAGRVWHRQAWEFATLAQAEARFAQRLREKTNPARRSRRK
ncbi:MAG: hypothetical protein ACUVRZ_09620 [Desulfobacca sp.]